MEESHKQIIVRLKCRSGGQLPFFVLIVIEFCMYSNLESCLKSIQSQVDIPREQSLRSLRRNLSLCIAPINVPGQLNIGLPNLAWGVYLTHVNGEAGYPPEPIFHLGQVALLHREKRLGDCDSSRQIIPFYSFLSCYINLSPAMLISGQGMMARFQITLRW